MYVYVHSLLSLQGDIYFTSSSLIHNYKGDSRIVIAPEIKVPKNIDKRGFLSSGRFSEPDLPQVVYVYKICAEILVGRKDSNASTISIQSTDEVFTRSVVSDLMEDSHSDTSLDHVHPILSETEISERSVSFTGILPPSEGSSNGRTGSGRRKTVSERKTNWSELEADTASVSSTSKYSSHVILEGSVGSSPDSDAHDDLANSDKRTGGGRAINVGTTQHSVGGLHFRVIPTYNRSSRHS